MRLVRGSAHAVAFLAITAASLLAADPTDSPQTGPPDASDVTAEAAAAGPPQEAPAPAAQANAGPKPTIFIREFRLRGAKLLPPAEVQDAVYPFLGPERTEDDIEGAKKAIETLYRAKGYETVYVDVPEQRGFRGVIFLQVVEAPVGRLRVRGSRYFLPSRIKALAPSLKEGNVPNFNDVRREIVALNALPDRQIKPDLKAPGVEPGTVDVDLIVEDKFPLHGSLELNNRYSPDTPELRLNGSISYNNLWQRGHSLGFSFQVAPEDPEQVKIFSGYYSMRFERLPSFSLIFQGTKSDTNVSTLSGIAVAGRGETVGVRALLNLPPLKNYYHSISLGIDYKDQNTVSLTPAQEAALDSSDSGLGETLSQQTAIYYPLSAAYNGSWVHQNSTTELNLGVTLGVRGAGTSQRDFEESRFGADRNFLILRGDLSRTQTLPGKSELYAKVQGQLSDQPLISAEQFAGGGLGTVRGYLEAEEVGDNGLFGTLEFRSPSFFAWFGEKMKDSEFIVYTFLEGGVLTIRDPLPEQKTHFEFASFGFGSRMTLFDYLNGSVDIGWPLISTSTIGAEGPVTRTHANDPRVTFRVWAEF